MFRIEEIILLNFCGLFSCSFFDPQERAGKQTTEVQQNENSGQTGDGELACSNSIKSLATPVHTNSLFFFNSAIGPSDVPCFALFCT